MKAPCELQNALAGLLVAGKLTRIDGVGSMEDITARVLAAINGLPSAG